MNPLQKTKSGYLFFDGAMGTMLAANGLAVNEGAEIFNIKAPGIVQKIHTEYVNAGADIVTTNTFGANAKKLSKYNLTAEEMIITAVVLAKNSGAEFVALGMGPIGELIEPYGDLTPEEAYDLFKEQAVAGENAGADMALIETMSDLQEAVIAVKAVKENTMLPVGCTMSFEQSGHTFMGVDPATAIKSLEEAGVDAVGFNCSLGPKEAIKIAEEFAKYSKLPLIAQPNAGLPEIVDGKSVYVITPREFCDNMKEIADRGFRIFGGCCGTTPEFIKELKNRLPRKLFSSG